MTSVKFFYCNNMLNGFEVSDHATTNANDTLGALVCASISSAVYLTANTLTDVVFAKASITEKDGYFKLLLKDNIKQSQTTLKGFKMHIENLCSQYNSNIKIDSEEK